MGDPFSIFERITRVAHSFRDVPEAAPGLLQHPFDERNIHPSLPGKVRKLFDDGHCAEATFETFKFLDKTVARHAALKESGFKLMMQAFNETNPRIKLNALIETSEVDEQKGYAHLFAGGTLALRNPRGHEYGAHDDPDVCLDHLAFASLLLRRMAAAGYEC